jgi:uncharacterized protein with GYD domain
VPTYLTAFEQTADIRAELAANSVDRRESLGPVIEKTGGKLLGYWYAFGDVDGCALIEAPDDVAAASLLVRVAASRAVSVSTTKLLTVDEALQAFRQAGDVGYRPPGSWSERGADPEPLDRLDSVATEAGQEDQPCDRSRCLRIGWWGHLSGYRCGDHRHQGSENGLHRDGLEQAGLMRCLSTVPPT